MVKGGVITGHQRRRLGPREKARGLHGQEAGVNGLDGAILGGGEHRLPPPGEMPGQLQAVRPQALEGPSGSRGQTHLLPAAQLASLDPCGHGAPKRSLKACGNWKSILRWRSCNILSLSGQFCCAILGFDINVLLSGGCAHLSTPPLGPHTVPPPLKHTPAPPRVQQPPAPAPIAPAGCLPFVPSRA